MARAFIIDTDTASDNAVALIMALRWPDVDVKAITIVAGNVGLEQAYGNALYTAFDRGGTCPFIWARASHSRASMRTHSGFMGRMDWATKDPPPTQQAESKHAVDAIIETVKANPGIVMVTLGPLTNIALAVSKAPAIVP